MAQQKIIGCVLTLVMALLLDCNVSGRSSQIDLPAQETGATYTSLSCSRNKTDNCPWFICINQSCKCVEIFGDPLYCKDDGNVSILDCNCITYDGHNKIEVGMCIYNCMNLDNKSTNDVVYHEVSNNVSMLNNMVCAKFNRQGTLCGQCKNGTFPLVYSFNLTCVSCPDTKITINWLKYISVAFIPLTIFYFIVVLFKINIASSHLHSFVVYSQGVTVPVMSRVLVLAFQDKPKYVTLFARTICTLYGVWNLDFFRSFEFGICLRINTLLILSLDFIVAVYPLMLMVLSYTLINLYDQNYRLLVIMWRPFHSFFSLFHKKWDIRTSLVDSFATFLVLSYVKLLSVAHDLLLPVQVHSLSSSGNAINHTTRLFYDATVTYFGKTHLPYAILAIVCVAVFVILPALVLLLYPLRCFQKLLNALPVRWHILHTFMDSFQGCYKDGTQPGTRDCRWFVSLFILGRFAIAVLSIFTANSMFFVFASVTLTLFSILLLVVQPFKPKFNHYSRIIATFLIFLALFYVAISGMDLTSIKLHKMTSFFFTTILFLWCLPLLYVSFLTLQWIRTHRKFGLELFRRWQARRQGYQQLCIVN